MPDQTFEGFGTVPNSSANFGNLPHDAEGFRTIRDGAERTEHHTLTVREVARMFEQAGVPRTERSIINWCQINRQGIARLDAFFDTNERKYFITPQSVHLAVQEEKAKQTSTGVSGDMETPIQRTVEEVIGASEVGNGEGIRDLRRKITDLEITNRVKEQFVEMLQKDRERIVGEREGYVRELMAQSRRIGELETQVLQLGAPVRASSQSLPKGAESTWEEPDDVGGAFREAGFLESSPANDDVAKG
jgi:hypothetical protein